MLKIWEADNFRRTPAGLCMILAPIAFGASDIIRLAVEGAEGNDSAAIAARPGLWMAARL